MRERIREHRPTTALSMAGPRCLSSGTRTSHDNRRICGDYKISAECGSGKE
jgi:hypothetical protein